MRPFLSLLFFFNFIHAAHSQNSYDFDFSKHFAMEVHSVDDFFERFNFKKNSSFNKYIAALFPEHKIERSELIVSLFNKQNSKFNPDEIKKFIYQVTDSVSPAFLNYRDKEWYAEIKCKVNYNKKASNLTLILKVIKSKNNGYSWDIVSAKADFLKFQPIKSDSSILNKMKNVNESLLTKNASYFLSPVSHGIEFTNLDNIFINNTKFTNYIYPGPRSFELVKLEEMILKSKIIFVQIETIRYHLLQINDWVLVLNQFNRKDMNSGWLINELIRVKNPEKEGYKKKQLNIPKI